MNSATLIGHRTMAGVVGGGSSGTTWFDREARIHAAALPNVLTESVSVVCGVANVTEAFGINVLDADKEGGAIKGNNAAWGRLVQPMVYQSLVTSKFAVSFQGSFAAIAALKANYFGLVNVAGTQGILVGTAIGNVPFGPTDFIAFPAGAGLMAAQSLGTANSNVYTWRILINTLGTIVSVSRSSAVGGGVDLNTATFSTADVNYPTGKGSPGIFANLTMSGQALYKCLYSFVGPQ